MRLTSAKVRKKAALAGLVACVAAPVVSIGPAGAVLSTVSCGTVVQEDLVLQADVGPCPGHGILVQSAPADNITVDLNGHRVIGIPGSPPGVDGQWAGIRLAGADGVTIKNGTVTGFGYGIALNGADRATITNMTLRDNIGARTPQGSISGGGVTMFIAHDTTVRANRIIHNGPSAGISVSQSGGAVIENNVVQDNNVRNDDGNGHFPGQLIQQDDGILLQGGEIPPRDPSQRRGNHIVRNNRLIGNGLHGVAITGLATDNLIVGNYVADNGLDQPADLRLIGFGNGIHVAAGVKGAQVENNLVTGNGGSGIFVFSAGNVVRRNTAVFNSQRTNILPNFDLHDEKIGCPGNVWSQNRFITYNQPCVTA